MDQIPDAQVIADLAAAGVDVQTVGADEVPFVVIPDNYQVETLERFLPTPIRIEASPTFISLESFIRYVNKFKVADTRIMLSRSGQATAVLDASGPDDPAWEKHFAHFAVTYSDRWRIWDAMNKRPFTQKQFAEFVEDNNFDFLVPKGAAMLDIAETLHAEQNSTFESAVRHGRDNVHLVYKKTTTGKAGTNGEFDIPQFFELKIPVLENEPPRVVAVRLRYELDNGKLSLHYEIIQRTALLEELRRSIYAIIKNETGIDPYAVA